MDKPSILKNGTMAVPYGAVPTDGFSKEGLIRHVEELANSFLNEPTSCVTDGIHALSLRCRVELMEELPPPPIAMKVKSGGEMVTLFTKGNFSVITGAAKSRKSFLVSMLMAASIKGESQIFRCPSTGNNVLFDTEQSRYKVQQIIKRICSLCGGVPPKNFVSYSLRTLDPSQRMDLIEHVLETTPDLNFVAIDGIIDLDIDPILQANQAHGIIAKLMK